MTAAMARSSPNNSTRPLVGVISPRIRLTVVVLPAPFGPSSPTTLALHGQVKLVYGSDLTKRLPAARSHGGRSPEALRQRIAS